MPTFWTIQHIEKWKEFESTGVLVSDGNFIEPCFITAYNWIIKQMKMKLPAMNGNPLYPVWAWYKFSDDRYRPDLRRSGYLEKGTKGVMIEFEESFENVLLTDFMDWHLVLISRDDEEIKNETSIISPDEEYKWSDIIINCNQTERISQLSIQATLWKLSIEKVRKVTPFTAR
jgi:hypothetical protein